MVIVLTKYEKRTFFGFLGLYLGSSLFLLVVIGRLFYTSQAASHAEVVLSRMEIAASNISSKIIHAHMSQLDFDMRNIDIAESLAYGLYDENKLPIYTQIPEHIDLSKKIYITKEATFYISKAPTGHLGVYFVVIKEDSLDKDLDTLQNDIIAAVVAVYMIIALIGFVLAKLFIYPIQSQREKLNNFVKDTTHELNTPLSALMLCVDAKDFNSVQNKERIKISAKKISNLYKDLTYLLLDEHKIESAKEIELSKILRDELVYFKQIAQKKSITLITEVEETLFKIDKEDFMRVINNLISNAIKYNTRGGKVYITLKNNVLCIEDTGIGIEASKLDKIFTRYFRATSSVGGFGIGLNIVSAICKTYKIKIDVSSTLHVGTKFTLYFK